MQYKLKLLFRSLAIIACCSLQLAAYVSKNLPEKENIVVELLDENTLKSEQAKEISRLLKQIYKQTNPSATKEVAQELALILTSTIIGALLGYAGSIAADIKPITTSRQPFIDAGLGAYYSLYVFNSLIFNAIKILINCLPNKTSKTLKQIKILAGSKEISMQEIQALSEELSMIEIKQKPVAARILRVLAAAPSLNLVLSAKRFSLKNNIFEASVILLLLAAVEGTEYWNRSYNKKIITEIKKLFTVEQNQK